MLKAWNFVIYFSRLGECLNFAHKVGRTWNFNAKPEKNHDICKFCVLKFTFQDVIYKKKNPIYFFDISTLWTETLIQSQIDMGFNYFFLQITWKIHGFSCPQRSGYPDLALSIVNVCFSPADWLSQGAVKDSSPCWILHPYLLLHTHMCSSCEMNNYIVRSCRDVIVVTKIATTLME